MNNDEDYRLKEAFMDMLEQSCSEYETYIDEAGRVRRRHIGYDSQYLSAYEHALSLAVEFGWIKKSEWFR